ncbi:MAG TPA: 50S ribosomal protein L21 [Myxococcota bacterium]|nr:50S ribosomal protein L21 [Myxococcota bacterium]
MYAVVKTGGLQVRVTPGKAVRVGKLAGEVGAAIEFDQVLLVGGEGDAKVGTPLLAGAKVLGTIKSHGRGEKITIFKSKRRKNYRRKQGHRQDYTEVQVTEIRA